MLSVTAGQMGTSEHVHALEEILKAQNNTAGATDKSEVVKHGEILL